MLDGFLENPVGWIFWIGLGTVFVALVVGGLYAAFKPVGEEVESNNSASSNSPGSGPTEEEFFEDEEPDAPTSDDETEVGFEPQHVRIVRLLAEYAERPRSGLAKALKAFSEHSTSGVAEAVGVRGIIECDLGFILSSLSIPGNSLSYPGARIISNYRVATGVLDADNREDPWRLIEVVEEGDLDGITSLRFLVRENHPDRHYLSDLFIEFATLVAERTRDRNPDQVGRLDEVLEQIRATARTQQEMQEGASRFVEESRALLDDLKAAATLRVHQLTLGVSEACSAADIKAAYRSKVALWHPDKLEGMAPELNAAATKKMGELNEAYDYLQRYLGARSI